MRKVRLAILLGILALFACGDIGAVKIENILANPRQYSSDEVVIRGEVIDVFSLFIIKCFMIGDDTGQIMVVSEKPLPKSGERLRIKGRVQEAFSFGNQQLIVLLESSQ